ncbi:lectin subunit alpha-like [Musca autumnalis]|uniref:lectin subunit alpha-like n=1 Tax=Musca autumnalis TaxID=221902 RepID=UPI003CEC0746
MTSRDDKERKFVEAIPNWLEAEDGHIYLIDAEQNFDWHQAVNECKRRGLRLVEIESLTKSDALDALLRNSFEGSLPNLWIGASDLEVSGEKNRPFYWSMSGKRMTFSNWANKQPDNYKGNEHCVHIYSPYNLKWNDVPCTFKQGFICETRFMTK